jgi:PEP-CTERM motif
VIRVFALAGMLSLLAGAASATTVVVDFGSGEGISSTYPGCTSSTGCSPGGQDVVLTSLMNAVPIIIEGPDGTYITVTSNFDGSVTGKNGQTQYLGLSCVEQGTSGTCGYVAPPNTGGNAYGLGVDSTASSSTDAGNRIDVGETVIFTFYNPNNTAYRVSLVNFTVLGNALNSGNDAKYGYYSFSGPVPTGYCEGTTVPSNCFNTDGLISLASSQIFQTITFGAPAPNNGDYTLANITFNFEVPEPATFALVGLALLGLAFIRLRGKSGKVGGS